MIHFKKTLSLAVAAALTTPVWAQDDADVVITASRTAETYSETLASVTVITREDIDNSQARSIQDLLTGYRGLDIRQSGGQGKVSSVFMRGTKTAHTLFLIDGVKLGSASLGLTSFQHIPLNQIERIEIVRGPRSSLYGSEAIGGVIQVFTRKGSKEHKTHTEFGVGSDNLSEGSISTSGSLNNTRYNLTLSSQKTGGVDARTDSETDDDGYQNNAVSLNLSHQYTNGTEVQATIMHAEGNTEYDGNNMFSNNSDYVQQAASLKVTHDITDSWTSSLSLGSSKDDDIAKTDLAVNYRFTTKHREASWQNDIAINDNNLLTVGLDYQKDDVGDDNGYTEEKRDNKGVFVQHQTSFGNSEVTLSARNDDNEAFGDHATGSIALGHKLGNSQLYASYGTAFKAPTFSDLYSPWGGNDSLKPEESESFEIGARSTYDWGSIETSLYQTNIDEMITWICVANCSGFGTWQPMNVDEAEIKGIEFALNTAILGWDTRAELSWVDPKDKNTGKVLQLRAKETASVDLQRQFNAFSLGINVLAQGSRYEDVANTTELGGYGLVNLRGSYSLDKQWQLKARIDNVGNKEYTTNPGYNTFDRTYFIGVAYQSK